MPGAQGQPHERIQAPANFRRRGQGPRWRQRLQRSSEPLAGIKSGGMCITPGPGGYRGITPHLTILSRPQRRPRGGPCAHTAQAFWLNPTTDPALLPSTLMAPMRHWVSLSSSAWVGLPAPAPASLVDWSPRRISPRWKAFTPERPLPTASGTCAWWPGGREMAALTGAADVQWCDGSQERPTTPVRVNWCLRTFRKPNPAKAPTYLGCPTRSDAVRVEDCTSSAASARKTPAPPTTG